MKHCFLILTAIFFAFPASAEKIRLALNWKPEPQFGGFYAAEVAGHFKKAGLDVEILPGGSGTPTIQMVAANQAEYAIVSADEIILSHDRGSKDVVALFAAYQTNPQGIMSHEDKNYKSIKSILEDPKATVQWQPGLPYAEFLRKKYGPLKAKTAPYLGGIGPFQKDKSVSQQCFVTSEPLTAAAAGLKVKTFLVADEGYNPYTTVLVTKKARLEKSKGEVDKVIAAVKAGWTDYLKDPTATNSHMAKLNPAMTTKALTDSAAAQKNLIETDFTKKTSLGKMETSRWQALIDQMFDLKLVKTKPKADAVFVDKL